MKADEKTYGLFKYFLFHSLYTHTINSLICQKAVKHANGTILGEKGVLAEMNIFIQVYYMPHFIVE